MIFKKLPYWKKGIIIGISISIIWTILEYFFIFLSFGLIFSNSFLLKIFWEVGLFLSSLDPSNLLPEKISDKIIESLTIYGPFSGFLNSIIFIFIFKLIFFAIICFLIGIVYKKTKLKKHK